MLTAVKIELDLDGRRRPARWWAARSRRCATSATCCARRSLDDLGLVAALRALPTTSRARPDLASRSTWTDRRVACSPDVEVVIYRVVQEALTNVARHAHAHRRPGCTLDCGCDRTSLVVEDDGQGVGVQNASRTWAGSGMRNGSRRWAAHCRSSSAAAGGVRLEARMPVGVAA